MLQGRYLNIRKKTIPMQPCAPRADVIFLKFRVTKQLQEASEAEGYQRPHINTVGFVS